MVTWAVVPVKSLAASKSRLSPVLGPAAREALVRRMLEQTLDVLRECTPPLEGTLVISMDERVLQIACTRSAIPLAEMGGDGLNSALTQGVVEAIGRGAQAILILPADLPRLSAHAVGAFLASLPAAPAAVLAPDRWREGTNALACSPPGLLAPAFGSRSFERHCAQARALQASLAIDEDPALALDIDTPQDLGEIEDLVDKARLG